MPVANEAAKMLGRDDFDELTDCDVATACSAFEMELERELCYIL